MEVSEVKTVEANSLDQQEVELFRRLASLEYAGAVRALVPFVIPAMLVASFYVVGATGAKIFTSIAVIPLAVIMLALVWSVRE